MRLNYKIREFIELVTYIVAFLMVYWTFKILTKYDILKDKDWVVISSFITLVVFAGWLGKILIYNNPLISYGKKTPFLDTDDDEADSKKEAFVANYLLSKGIEYKPHKEIIVRDKKLFFLTSFIKIKPDFYLPKYDVFIEYYGIADKNKIEDMKARAKTKLYHDNKLKIMPLYPRHLDDLDRAIMQNKYISKR